MFAKILIPQYQSNDVENCLVLSPICQVRFSNLPGFTRSLFAVEIEDFLQKDPLKACKNERKQQAKFLFVLLPSNNDSWMCSCIVSSWENGIPLNKLFTLRGRLFNPPNRKHVLKRAECHRCEVNTLGTLPCNLSTFLRFPEQTHSGKLPTESERSDQF